jgi:hypothetical protein
MTSVGRSRACFSVLAAGLLLAASASVGPVRGAGNELSNGRVTPLSGTTSTVFAFSVDYSGKDPSSVTATVGSVVVTLRLATGTAGQGTYRAGSRLPPGTRAVTFQATAVGRHPSLLGPTVTVTGSSTPTAAPSPSVPAPTPVATPAATRNPAPTPLTATPLPATPSGAGTPAPSAGQTPQGGGFVGGVVATPRPSSAVDPAVGSEDEPPGQLWTLITGVLIAVGVLGVLGVFALLRGRHGAAVDARLALLPAETTDEPLAVSPARRRAEWEEPALDDEPIGTVHYLPPPPRRE